MALKSWISISTCGRAAGGTTGSFLEGPLYDEHSVFSVQQFGEGDPQLIESWTYRPLTHIPEG